MKIFILLISLVTTQAINSNEYQLLSISEVKNLAQALQLGTVNSDELAKSINIGNNVLVPYSFSITSKGNGVINILNTSIRIYDQHNDGNYFKSGLLNNRLIDLNKDGYQDLVVSGIAITTGPKGDDYIEKNIKAVLQYSPSTNTFEIISKSGEIDVWTSNQ